MCSLSSLVFVHECMNTWVENMSARMKLETVVELVIKTWESRGGTQAISPGLTSRETTE